MKTQNAGKKTRMFVMQLCLMSLMIGLLPVLTQAGVTNDAYSYSDNFEDDTGLNLAESSGVTLTAQGLAAETAPALAVSQCITLPQPAGGVFQGWAFLDLRLSNSGGTSTLEIQDCSGATLSTVNTLPDGDSSLDLSAISVAAIRLQWHAPQAGSALEFWRLFGRAEGVTSLAVTPNTLTPDAGDTITFTIDVASSGATTRNPALRFSLDDINGLHTPEVDDGLAEDAEVDYGSGVNAYRPLEFMSASAGPNGEVPTTPADGATEGEIVWHLDDLSDGFADNVTVTLRVPKGYINGKTLAARAELEHGNSSGGCENQMSEEETSELATVNAVYTPLQSAYTPYSNVGPGATNIYNRYFIRNNLFREINPSDLEDITVTITGIGDCTPLFRRIYGYNRDYPFQVISTPAVGAPITASDPVIVRFDRLYYHYEHYYARIHFDVPGSCSERSEIGTQSEMIVGNPVWTETDDRTHDVVLEVCRKGGNHTHRVMSGNIPQDYYLWPGWPEQYIFPNGSLRAGEYFTTWAPYGNEGWRTHTVTLDHSYDLIEVPAGVTFHGIRETGQLDRLYKDCTGTAPIPTDPAFDHSVIPPHPAWKPVGISWDGSPFTNPPDESDPQAVVQSGCRLLGVNDDDNPAWQGPDFGIWKPVFLWRTCDGSYGCVEIPDGSAMSLVGGTIYTYETVLDSTGTAHECHTHNGYTLYKEHKSWPKLYTWPEQNQMPAGQMAHIILNPENENYASQYVDGRWGINLYDSRDYIDLASVTGEVMTEDLNIPQPDQNVTGQSCHTADISFHAPDPAACLSAVSADDPACLAWWEVPAACQPPNGWGYQISGDYSKDQYVQLYRLQLNAPILRSTPANTVLDFTAEVRTNDLTSRGADNAVDSTRWSADNYTATTSVTVLEVPGMDASKTGPAARKPGDRLTYTLDVQNIGNTPNNGWYLVDWLPRAGVNNSELTPDYQRVFVDQAADDVIVEYTTDAACFTSPLSGGWSALTLQGSSRPGYLAQTVEIVPADATCVRLRRNPASMEDFTPGETIQAALDGLIPNDPALEGQVLFNRALTGAAANFGATTELAPVETVNVRTLVSSDVVAQLEKRTTIDPTRAGWIIWTLRVHNASGSAAANVSVVDELPLEVSYEGLADSLPAGWTLLQAPEIGDIGGQLAIMIPALAPDDGNPDSGDDEGLIVFHTRVVDGIPDGTDISNSAAVTPEIGQGDQACASTGTPQLDAAKAQEVADRLPDSAMPDVYAGDVFSYLITAANVADQAVYLGIYDALDAYLAYQPGTLAINGATASDAAFTGDLLDYRSTELLNPGDTLTFGFDVRVSDVAPHNWLIENMALITVFTDQLDPLGSAWVAVETNRTVVRVETTIPEPATLMFFGLGLLGLLALRSRKRGGRKM